jgi:PAS domain S-box-containing protein
MAADPITEEAKRSFTGQLVAIAGADAAQRLQPALDVLVAGVASAVAARASAEAATLRERNRMLETLLDALPDAVVLSKATGEFAFVNRAAASTISYWDESAREPLPTQEIEGKTLEQLHAPPPIARNSEERFARIAAGETVKHEVFLRSSEGWRWRETVMSPIRDQAGTVAAVAICSRDIHERKLAERRLRLLSKLTGLTDATADEGVFAALARLAVPELGDWCLVEVVEDGRLRRVRAVHDDPALAPLADQLMRAPASPEHERSLRRLVAGGSFLLPQVSDESLRAHGDHRELRALLAQLGARSLLVVPLVLQDELAAVATFVCSGETRWQYGPDDRALAEAIARRATQTIENVRLHQQLRESEERFRVALKHAHISVFEVDLQLRFRWLHVPVEAQALPAAIGRTFAEVNQDATELTALVRRAIDGGRGVTAEIGHNYVGEPLCLLASIEPVRDPSGEVIGAIGAATNITETKRGQEELARALGFRDQMLGILGHDLRNPLSAVSGLASLLLLACDLPPAARAHVEHIEEAARRMMEMISTLLDFAQSRFKEGLPVAPAPCDLSEIAAAAVADLRAAHHGQVIELEAPPNATGHYDGARMAQVVSNLVGNAIVHGDRAAAVRVAIAVADEGVVLRVMNRGPMIPGELVSSLFEPFKQGAAEGAARPGGLGLGLYIVDQIVRGHGGTISVESTPDCTTFCVRLPRCA